MHISDFDYELPPDQVALVIIVAIASVFGLAPKGGKPVAGTRLMSVARFVLVAIGLILLYVGFRRPRSSSASAAFPPVGLEPSL